MSDLTRDLATLLRALAYEEDPCNRVVFRRIAQDFLAAHQDELDLPEWVHESKAEARDIEKEIRKALWTRAMGNLA